MGLQPGAPPVRYLLPLTGFEQHQRRLGIQPLRQGQQRGGVIRARQADPVRAQSMPRPGACLLVRPRRAAKCQSPRNRPAQNFRL
jgi:hypothetical protein